MTDAQLEKANKIKHEIKRLEDFFFYAERVWEGKLVKETAKYIFKSHAYGHLESASYELDTDTKNELLVVLQNKLDKLRIELIKL